MWRESYDPYHRVLKPDIMKVYNNALDSVNNHSSPENRLKRMREGCPWVGFNQKNIHLGIPEATEVPEAKTIKM